MSFAFNSLEGVFDLVSNGGGPPGDNIQVETDAGTAISVLRKFLLKGGPGVKVKANPNGSNSILVNIDEILPAYTSVTNPNVDHSPYDFVANTDDNYFISVDSTLGPVTIFLPDAGSANPPPQNSQFIVKDRTGQSQTYHITIESENGLATIDQQSTYVFVDAFESLECIYNGTNYEIF
jgi:hypothetical protein